MTIEELKERMSYSEAQAWGQYRLKRGPLNAMMRMDNGFALIAMMINHACGGKAEISDFLRYGKPGDEVMTDPMDFINMFKAK